MKCECCGKESKEHWVQNDKWVCKSCYKSKSNWLIVDSSGKVLAEFKYKVAANENLQHYKMFSGEDIKVVES